MERHGGTVRLRTRPGEGTEVHLCLPLREVEIDPAAVTAPAADPERMDRKETA
jgi:hypothetical protein